MQGYLRVMYFAPNPVLARFEARDVLGHWSGAAVPAPGRPRHVVVEYRIELGGKSRIVDARHPQFSTLDTTLQEMTGDWATYPWETPNAPTQNLARAVFRRPDAPDGLIAPSARNPREANLVLFPDRLPPRSISFVAIHLWHESQLVNRA